jgi:hypothetical protein
MAPTPEICDKHGHPISIGDHVYTPIRSGRHEGIVEKIAYTQADAQKYGVKHPPKVIFQDQLGRTKAHNPRALTDLSKDEPEEIGHLRGRSEDEE